MLSRIRKRLRLAAVLGLFAVASLPSFARAQSAPDTLILPALVLPVPARPLRPLPVEGLPTSSRGRRGASWSVVDGELTVGAILEKVLQRNPALAPGAVGNAFEVEAQRLILVEEARQAFADYCQAYQQLGRLDEGLRRLRHCRAVAESRWRTGAAPAQDVFQADVEVGRWCERRVGLEKQARVACARLNTLMQLPPEAALPPPPPLLPPAGELPDVAGLHEAALARRPEVQALRHRLGVGQRELAAAQRGDLRQAAAAGGPARVSPLHAEFQRLTSQVRFQVEAAFTEVRASAQSVALLQEAVLRDAEANAAAAESGYQAGRVPFLSWVEAERNRLDLQLRRHEVLAEYHRRRAALARAIADPPQAHDLTVPPPRITEAFHEKIYPAAHLTAPAPR
jgi:hypothetical protein